jgi:hypothetical protein
VRWRSMLLFFTGLLSAGVASANDSAAKAVFEQLKTLTGNWREVDAKASTLLEVKTIANGSSLVETWTMSPTRQSITVYTMDGTKLLATHFCPQGNAPRLSFVRTDASGAHHFEFVDGANLQDAKGRHQHAFWIRKNADGTVTRNETYILNGAKYDPEKDLGGSQNFSRVQ